MIAFGRSFIANPDLPARLFSAALLTEASPEVFCGGGAKGDTDLRTIEGTAATDDQRERCFRPTLAGEEEQSNVLRQLLESSSQQMK